MICYMSIGKNKRNGNMKEERRRKSFLGFFGSGVIKWGNCFYLFDILSNIQLG